MTVVGSCKMCGKIRPLVKSHIIPDWAFRPIYDEKHRILRVALDDSRQTGYIPTGEWDRILCGPCEAGLGEFDEYGRAVVYSKPGETTFGIESQAAVYGVDILNIDYPRMKLFQLTVLWRAGVSEREFSKDVKLGSHEPIIRDMIFDKNPGDAVAYGCIMGIIRHNPREMLDQVIDQPTTYSDEGWTYVRFLFAGCVWLYVLDGDAHNFPKRELFLAPSAPLRLPIYNLEDIPGLVKRLGRLGDSDS